MLLCGVVIQVVGLAGARCPHLFQRTAYDQEVSLNEHNTKRICRTCGELLSEEKGEHVYKTATGKPTEAQLKACPEAQEVISETCIVCKHVKSVTAVLTELTFDGDLKIPIDEYVGSKNYTSLMAQNPIESYRRTIAYFDQDPVFECWGTLSNGSQAVLSDGKLVMTNANFFVNDLLNSVGVDSVYENLTITFDILINSVPNGTEPFLFFSMTDNTVWNYMPIVLFLDETPRSDDSSAFEFGCYSRSAGTNYYRAYSGEYLELGKEYTFKIEIDRDVAKYTLSYKLSDAEEFKTVGVFRYLPSRNTTAIRFAASHQGTGNAFDNYRVTTKLK